MITVKFVDLRRLELKSRQLVTTLHYCWLVVRLVPRVRTSVNDTGGRSLEIVDYLIHRIDKPPQSNT